MIPRSVRMSGWMRYRDEQVAEFGDGRLIAICGENGAGKSSIFDAITFALYGKHRLGKMHADQLISEDMDRLSVEFEFEAEHDGRLQRFLVRRSRGRKQGERDQGLWIWDEGAGDWTTVPGTEKEDALERALASIIRLSAEAFTSSFMLQQGEATEFIDADPKPRFEIVSSLIGLDEYKRLEARAREAQRDEKRRLDDLKAKLGQYDGVDEGALARLAADVAAAAERAAAASVALTAARASLADAARYATRVAEIAALDARIAGADALIAGAAKIESDAATFTTLSGAIDTVKRIAATLTDAAREEAAAHAAQQGAAAIDVGVLDSALAAAAAETTAAQKTASAAEKAHAAASTAERAASDFVALARAVLDGRKRVVESDASIAQHESQLAALPDATARAEVLGRVKDALPALRALREAVEHLEQLQKGGVAETAEQLEAQRRALAAGAEEIETQLAGAEAALGAARNAAAAADAGVAALDVQLRERKAAAGESTCSRCGQPVDKKQAAAEVKELTAALAAAKQGAADAAKAAAAADASCASLRKRQKEDAAAIAALAPKIAAAQSRERELVKAAAGVEQRRAGFAEVAPAELAQACAGATGAAAIAKVIAAHGDAPKQADALRKQVEHLRGIEGQRVAAVAERDRAQSQLAADEGRLNGRLKDAPEAASAHAVANQQLVAAAAALAGARAAFDAASKREASARDAMAQGRERRAELDAEIARRDAAASGHRATTAAFAEGLGDVIGPAALADADDMLRTLGTRLGELGDAPARFAALQEARSNRVGWAGERGAKQSEVDGIPQAHRIDEGAAATAVAACEAAASDARDQHAATLRELTEMQLRIEDVASMKRQREAAELRFKRLRTLVKLLGKDGLQGALVTDALGQITSHANAFLQRLTGGSLLLSIQQEGDALELQAMDATCMRVPHPIKALSGSQKFRCAVAIASGIGQYAGAGGMRSIVIDEGFASLDQVSQQMMVDELKDLATHMDKVIVVSHLEAFTNRDNFPDQILVEAAGNGSRITRTF
jgi:DNA repair exonuclease SbcCD ATPase subunit